MIHIKHGPVVDFSVCKGCKLCYDACPMDVFGWDKEKNLPLVLYPGECRLCGSCEMACPELAIYNDLPLHARIDLGIYPSEDIG